MKDNKSRTKKTSFALAIVFVIAGALISGFAWTANWFGNRVTTKTFLANVPSTYPAGYRRAHGKGMCFEGYFISTGFAARYSKASVFSKDTVNAIGRFSIGNGDPFTADHSSRIVGMGLMLTSNDRQQWRMKLNNQPYFPTHDAVGFIKLGAATKPDSLTGQPNPNRIAAFLNEYPEASKFLKWADTAPWTDSFAGAQYNVVDAFYFVDSKGQKRAVRWAMKPRSAFKAWTADQRKNADPNFLFNELRERLKKGPLYWDLIVTFASPADRIEDPSQPWPEDRKHVNAGELVITQIYDQADGPCRDINFDPTRVPDGIEPSNDPVLTARAGIYAHSYNARLREIGYGKATTAVGKKDSATIKKTK